MDEQQLKRIRDRLGYIAYEPSKYQFRIFDWILNEDGNGIVNAVAGSGKTATLELASRLVDDGLFCAFNKHIAEELGERITSMDVKTIHSLGFATLRESLSTVKFKPKGGKFHFIVKDLVDLKYSHLEWPVRQRIISDLKKASSLVRLNLIDVQDSDAVYNMLAHHGIFLNGYYDDLVKVLDRGEEQSRYGVIDFDDMIYLVYKWNLTPKQYTWVFVDECQDLNKAQLEVTLRACKGRSLYVGDPKQAIYGFAGADAYSYDNIRHRINAVELPLSICYRCPVSHIEMAKELVPQIEAAPNAKEGVIDYVQEAQIIDSVKPNDMILCRTNAPLVAMTIHLIRHKIPARMVGRDIAEYIKKIIEEVSEFDGFTYDALPDFLDTWVTERHRKLESKGASDAAKQAVDDYAACVSVLWDEYLDCKTPECLCNRIEELFQEEEDMVILSTVHKAKGLENDRIFLLKHEIMPLIWKDQLDWQYQQELNILYIAYTRSKTALVFLD